MNFHRRRGVGGPDFLERRGVFRAVFRRGVVGLKGLLLGRSGGFCWGGGVLEERGEERLVLVLGVIFIVGGNG